MDENNLMQQTGENKEKSCGNPEYKTVALVFEIIAYVLFSVLSALAAFALEFIASPNKTIETLGFVLVIGVWIAAVLLGVVIIVEYILIKKAYGRIFARLHFFILSILMWNTIAVVVVLTAIFFALAAAIVFAAGGVLGG